MGVGGIVGGSALSEEKEKEKGIFFVSADFMADAKAADR